jgi:P22 coat protein - gene protein 5
VPNTFKILTFIANDMLRQVKNNLQFVKNVAGEDLAARFTDAPKKGETISVRKPTRYVGRTGETYTAEDYIERTVDMTVQTTAGVDITLTNRELMFQVDQISERVVGPAAMTLANILDRTALSNAYKAVYNSVGTPGTIPNALKTYNQARALMSWEAAPADSHTLLVTPDMQVEAVDAGKTLFNPDGAIGSQYETGLIGRHAGAKVYEVQNLPVHTVGPLGGAPSCASVVAGGAAINTTGWTAAASSRLKAGDTFTVAGCYAVNPWTRQSTGGLRKFTVTADFSSDGAGAGAVSVSPTIVTTGPFQNVSVSPSGSITVLGAASTVTPVGLRFHRDAFLFGTFKQPMPESAVEFAKVVTDPSTGISIRFIRDWDTVNNKQLNRFDVVWAWGVAYPEFACRIHS